MKRSLMVLGLALAMLFGMAQAAQAHVERPSYWPDPAPDCSISPCAGGAVPKARSLASALDRSKPGRTLVVCRPNSMDRLDASIKRARAHGFYIRPTDHRGLSLTRARFLHRVNERFFAQCRFHQIQTAVNAAGNNDRVVVMPGLYREPTARRAPTHDPACADLTVHSDSGDPGALSHEYQLECPNDANLIAVIGRGSGNEPDPALADRHGIPDPGPCIRCNLQLEGSGVSADDVIVEAGSAAAGNGGPSGVGNKKDVGLFVDQADGFVLRNMTFRHAAEHDIYVLETDGFLLDRFKAFYAGAYGLLTFVEDHALIQNCEAAGNGDSGFYPGSGAPTRVNRDTSFYPEARYSGEYRWCDIHHNTGGFSGTDSHGTLIDHNNFYDNSLGYTTDVFTAAGHPGFPQGGNVVEHNNFYSNNFNPYQDGSDVKPFIASPVGTGLWLAGGNDNVVRNNHFYDNWRRGVMLFAVPDATVCGPVLGEPVAGCNPLKISTSYNNRFYGNVMGQSPDGRSRPNGTDFWWDSFPTTTGNCWFDNTGPNGARVTSEPLLLPDCNGGKSPALSIGLGDVPNEAELIACLAGFQISGYPDGNSTVCKWTTTPAKPGTDAAIAAKKADRQLSAQQVDVLNAYCSVASLTRTCLPFLDGFGVLSWLDSLLTPSAIPTTVVPVIDNQPLANYNCSWWRQADEAHKLGLSKRLANWVGGSVDGDQRVGYGSVLSDDAAIRMLDDRCQTSYAGSFALYKIYGPAAGFAPTLG